MISYPPKLHDFDGFDLFLRKAREMMSEFTPRNRKKKPIIYAIKAGNAITVIPKRMKKIFLSKISRLIFLGMFGE
jgi:hypothetical protein